MALSSQNITITDYILLVLFFTFALSILAMVFSPVLLGWSGFFAALFAFFLEPVHMESFVLERSDEQ